MSWGEPSPTKPKQGGQKDDKPWVKFPTNIPVRMQVIFYPYYQKPATCWQEVEGKVNEQHPEYGKKWFWTVKVLEHPELAGQEAMWSTTEPQFTRLVDLNPTKDEVITALMAEYKDPEGRGRKALRLSVEGRPEEASPSTQPDLQRQQASRDAAGPGMGQQVAVLFELAKLAPECLTPSQALTWANGALSAWQNSGYGELPTKEQVHDLAVSKGFGSPSQRQAAPPPEEHPEPGPEDVGEQPPPPDDEACIPF